VGEYYIERVQIRRKKRIDKSQRREKRGEERPCSLCKAATNVL
jgi:hypothetical protein